MKKIFILLLLIVSINSYATPPGNTFYNVKDYGARGDGITIDGDAINKAIIEADKNGGGTIYFPAGNYMTYTIRLKNNICLFIDQGAVIVAAKEIIVRDIEVARSRIVGEYADIDVLKPAALHRQPLGSGDELRSTPDSDLRVADRHAFEIIVVGGFEIE